MPASSNGSIFATTSFAAGVLAPKRSAARRANAALESFTFQEYVVSFLHLYRETSLVANFFGRRIRHGRHIIIIEGSSQLPLLAVTCIAAPELGPNAKLSMPGNIQICLRRWLIRPPLQ